MAIIETPQWRIDYSDDGAGDPVILVHSSVSGNRQWRRLADDPKDRYRVLAINLFGYGETTPWPGDRVQTLADQAGLVRTLADTVEGPIHLVGLSFGGAVALKAASMMGRRVGRMVLIEPNPFHHLAQHGRRETHAEVSALREYVRRYGGAGDWMMVAERFVTFWVGDDAWRRMNEDRRATFAKALPPNIHEWDAVLDETTPLASWSEIPARVLLVWSERTRRPIHEIAGLLRQACQHWRSVELADAGHMAPLERPDLVNPLIAGFLDETAS